MEWLFDTSSFKPFREAQNWPLEMRYIWVMSNISISACCIVLMIALMWIWNSRRNDAMNWSVLATYSAFLLLLGLTFLFNIVTIYWAPFRFIVALRAACAIIAIGVACRMPFTVMHVLKLPSRDYVHDLLRKWNLEHLQKQTLEGDVDELKRGLLLRLQNLEAQVGHLAWSQEKRAMIEELRAMVLSIGGPPIGT